MGAYRYITAEGEQGFVGQDRSGVEPKGQAGGIMAGEAAGRGWRPMVFPSLRQGAGHSFNGAAGKAAGAQQGGDGTRHGHHG